MNLRQIFGIIMLIIIISSCVKYNKDCKKTKKELREIIEQHPERKEKINVLKSLFPEFSEIDKKESMQGIFILIIFFFFLLFMIIILHKYNIYQKNMGLFTGLLLLFFISFVICYTKIKDIKFKKYIKNILIQKYGFIKEDKKFQSLDIKQKNNFCFKILKYKCIVNNYYEKKIIKYHGSILGSRYKIKNIKNIYEYYYNLKSLGLKNIHPELMMNPIIKASIEEVSKIKLIDVKIIDDYLLISKLTVLNGYNKSDALIDINDVEFFYNEIVKKILDIDSDYS